MKTKNKQKDYKITGKSRRSSSNPLQILHELKDGSWVSGEELTEHYNTINTTDLFEQALKRRQEIKDKKKTFKAAKPTTMESRRLSLIKDILKLGAS